MTCFSFCLNPPVSLRAVAVGVKSLRSFSCCGSRERENGGTATPAAVRSVRDNKVNGDGVRGTRCGQFSGLRPLRRNGRAAPPRAARLPCALRCCDSNKTPILCGWWRKRRQSSAPLRCATKWDVLYGSRGCSSRGALLWYVVRSLGLRRFVSLTSCVHRACAPCGASTLRSHGACRVLAAVSGYGERGNGERPHQRRGG
jgi:hypothetical protein